MRMSLTEAVLPNFPLTELLLHHQSYTFALEIEKQNYDSAKQILKKKNIKIENEVTWDKGTNQSTFEILQEILLRSLLQLLGQ